MSAKIASLLTASQKEISIKFKTTLHPDHLSELLMHEVHVLQSMLDDCDKADPSGMMGRWNQCIVNDYFRVQVELTGNTEDHLIESITWVNQPREGDEWLSVDGKCFLYETAQRFLKENL